MGRSESASAYDQLSPKHRRFVDAYVGEARLNASRAYVMAGYAANDGNAIRLKGNERVSAAIGEKLAELAMSDAEAAAIIGEQARGTLSPFMRRGFNGVMEVDLSGDAVEQSLHLLKKVKQKKRVLAGDENTEVRVLEIETEIEIHDAQAAAHKIRQAHGAYGPKGTEDDPHHVKMLKWADE